MRKIITIIFIIISLFLVGQVHAEPVIEYSRDNIFLLWDISFRLSEDDLIEAVLEKHNIALEHKDGETGLFSPANQKISMFGYDLQLHMMPYFFYSLRFDEWATSDPKKFEALYLDGAQRLGLIVDKFIEKHGAISWVTVSTRNADGSSDKKYLFPDEGREAGETLGIDSIYGYKEFVPKESATVYVGVCLNNIEITQTYGHKGDYWYTRLTVTFQDRAESVSFQEPTNPSLSDVDLSF